MPSSLRSNKETQMKNSPCSSELPSLASSPSSSSLIHPPRQATWEKSGERALPTKRDESQRESLRDKRKLCILGGHLSIIGYTSPHSVLLLISSNNKYLSLSFFNPMSNRSHWIYLGSSNPTWSHVIMESLNNIFNQYLAILNLINTYTPNICNASIGLSQNNISHVHFTFNISLFK